LTLWASLGIKYNNSKNKNNGNSNVISAIILPVHYFWQNSLALLFLTSVVRYFGIQAYNRRATGTMPMQGL